MNQVQRVQPDEAKGLLTFIERAAKDPGFDVVKFGVLLDRHEAIVKQHQLTMFNQSYSAMQSEFKQILKTGANPTFRSPYAKLEDLDKAARPIYSAHGFSIRYGTAETRRDNWICVTLTIAHDGGHSETHQLAGPVQAVNRGQTPIQAVGSTITYLRRYLLQMVLNLVPRNDPADDDGEAQRISIAAYDPQTGEVFDNQDPPPSSLEQLTETINDCGDMEQLAQWRRTHRADYDRLSPDDKPKLSAALSKKAEMLKTEPAA